MRSQPDRVRPDSSQETSDRHELVNRTPATAAFDLIVIGASLGGLRALEVILSGLQPNCPAAIAIAQHRHRHQDANLAAFLQHESPLPLVEAEDKQAIVAGHIYLAPADYHLLIEPGHFALSTEAPVTYARPSIDVLFESAANAYAKRVIGVILTGASADGAQGLAKIEAYGGLAVVQDPSTAENRTMPNAAIAATRAAKILPLPMIAPFLVSCFC
ncbi:chemotaxis protein CheB [Leptolyngbya sp. NK1-12]|uniref:protein-glutamate methylesterase n=1 Tax=Leptolyngbya sp. NK1-12 TaxID=2547451 RepID=A0AA96WDT8_9CYAN|nr:chemotaxis protein CheB [Leptolyngbya sp. NK1-12]WNZ24397.1 chemotaxis protein CheB [Leptolyngbya sp. NK1-12]